MMTQRCPNSGKFLPSSSVDHNSTGQPSAPSPTVDLEKSDTAVMTCIEFLAKWLVDGAPLPTHLSRKKSDRVAAAFTCMLCANILGGNQATLSENGNQIMASLDVECMIPEEGPQIT